MPIYEYQCPKCGGRFEVRQPIGEDGSKLICPECGTPNPRRLISSFFSTGSSKVGSQAASCPTCSSDICGLPPMP